jgi:antagonist of KipI
LKKGDTLAIGELPNVESHPVFKARDDALSYLRNKSTIRITRGPQADIFSTESLKIFTSSTYAISESSNRVGLRLIGEAITKTQSPEMITEGTSLGAVQVPGDGQPIILFVEHPTTGGYPKIANVISADFCRLGQLRPRDEVHFQFVSFDEARELLWQQQRLLTQESIVRID